MTDAKGVAPSQGGPALAGWKLSLLAGIGFTVSLLIGELAFQAPSLHEDDVKVGVLMGSVVAAVLAALILRARNRAYRRLLADEEVDVDRDGVPDAFE